MLVFVASDTIRFACCCLALLAMGAVLVGCCFKPQLLRDLGELNGGARAYRGEVEDTSLLAACCLPSPVPSIVPLESDASLPNDHSPLIRVWKQTTGKDSW